MLTVLLRQWIFLRMTLVLLLSLYVCSDAHASKFSDIDLWLSKHSTENLRTLITHYPDSPYTLDAKAEYASILLEQTKTLQEAKERLPLLDQSKKLGFLNRSQLQKVTTLLNSANSLEDLDFKNKSLEKLLSYYPKPTPENKLLTTTLKKSATSTTTTKTPEKIYKTYKEENTDIQYLQDQVIPLLTDLNQGHLDSSQLSKIINSIQTFETTYPASSSQARARFWKAYALYLSNKKTEARELFKKIILDTPLSYYAVLASDYGNIQLTSRFETSEIPALSSSFPILERIQVIEQHHQQPSPQELQWISKQIPYSDLPAYAKLQSDKNDIFGSLLTLTEWLSRTPQPSISFSLLQLFYPTATLEQIQNQLQKNSPEDSQAKLNHQSLNSLWILSLIKQESGFNTQAISSSGALGLMQLMPFTASEQDPNRWKSEFLKPEYNLPSGILYLQKLQKKYASYKNFQMALILAAYNSGPHRVDQWLKQRPLLAQATELDKILWIETIPYKETREYVQAIFRNYYWYSYLVNTTKPTETIQTRDPVEFSEPSLF